MAPGADQRRPSRSTGARSRHNARSPPSASALRRVRPEHRDLRGLAREYQRQLVLERGLGAEAQVLELLGELAGEASGEAPVSLKDLTSRFLDRHQADYERRITPRWVGGLLKRLGLKAERRAGGYVLARGELDKLPRLLEKYGLTLVSEESPDEHWSQTAPVNVQAETPHEEPHFEAG